MRKGRGTEGPEDSSECALKGASPEHITTSVLILARGSGPVSSPHASSEVKSPLEAAPRQTGSAGVTHEPLVLPREHYVPPLLYAPRIDEKAEPRELIGESHVKNGRDYH